MVQRLSDLRNATGCFCLCSRKNNRPPQRVRYSIHGRSSCDHFLFGVRRFPLFLASYSTAAALLHRRICFVRVYGRDVHKLLQLLLLRYDCAIELAVDGCFYSCHCFINRFTKIKTIFSVSWNSHLCVCDSTISNQSDAICSSISPMI